VDLHQVILVVEVVEVDTLILVVLLQVQIMVELVVQAVVFL